MFRQAEDNFIKCSVKGKMPALRAPSAAVFQRSLFVRFYEAHYNFEKWRVF